MVKQSLLGQNTGANAVSNCELDVDVIEEKDEVEDATLYFRVGGYVCNKRTIEYDFTWFAIPPRGVVDSERHICSCFNEPRHIFKRSLEVGGSRYTPLAVGPYIFLISSAKHESAPTRDVLYLNAQNEKEWKEASPMVGKHARLCHFIVADDKIYAFGSVDNGNSLVVSSIDCKKPDQGWKVKENAVNGGPFSPPGLFESFFSVNASTIEYDTTGRRAWRALIFANDYRITYEFEANSYFSSMERLYSDPSCGVCPEGREIFFLIRDFDNSVNIKVYDQQNRKWCMTPVTGLNKYLPVAYKDYNLPPSRLVHLGNKRLCLVSALYYDANIEVHCTKFSVMVQQEGEYHATKVSSQVYKVNENDKYEFEAVVVCTSNEMILEFAVDNAFGVDSQLAKRKLSMGVKSDDWKTKNPKGEDAQPIVLSKSARRRLTRKNKKKQEKEANPA